ncbi:MAG: hypothetical protein Q4D60_02525 [Eubacteriales bacterium]|nr:hypothetical protein [Eubacteriales bacterium]
MITDKQRQRDYEYEADYQSKSRYTTEQWKSLLESGQLTEPQLSLLKQVYASYNHAATLLQLSFCGHATEAALLADANDMGKLLANANDIPAEVDFQGEEYWWFLFFWGKHTGAKETESLEWKLHPELGEAIGALWPDLEQRYYAFMNDVERSLQIRYTQEDSVWIAAAVLLYEKYYQNPGISADDILLMQYEVQTRAQKVFGQDVNVNTITRICNADEPGHRLRYLRDIYKYYRISYPGEFGGDRERPEDENIDDTAYIYSIYGYMTLSTLLDFVEHEYAHLVDASYVELNHSNGFVRLADFLTRQGGTVYDPEDTSEQSLALRADGEDCSAVFHRLADALIGEYPNFTYARKAHWHTEEDGRVSYLFCDVLSIEDYAHTHAGLSFLTIPDKDAVNIEIALNLPYCADEEAMLNIQEKCGKLPLMTAAPFRVENRATEGFDLIEDSQKLKASALYLYEDFKTMKEEDIIDMMSTASQILASYYTDICQNDYPAPDETMQEDPLAAALGSKLTYRAAVQVPGPQIIYKQGGSSPTSDYITRVLQGYAPTKKEETTKTEPDGESLSAPPPLLPSNPESPLPPENLSEQRPATFGEGTPSYHRTGSSPSPSSTASTHPDRREQGFRLYPKNTLIKGPVKTGKYHEAILTAVGIIEGKELSMMRIEPRSDVLEHYKEYVEEGRILHISYPDRDGDGYAGWIESRQSFGVQSGIFKTFANHCADGRYVVMMEEVNMNWAHLFGETAVLLRDNRREGMGSETAVTLSCSGETFTLPSNLYLVATCDCDVSEDTITGAVAHDFFIRSIAPNPAILKGIQVEGIHLERMMITMNQRISYFLGPDYQLGEGFFLSSPEKDPFLSLSRIFSEQIIPLLEKWFDGDMERIRYVLGDNGKQHPDTVFYQEIPFSGGLFLGEIPDSFDTGKSIYHKNTEAFFHPASYIGIYH